MANNNTNNNNHGNNSNINIKLNQTNYPTWRPIVENYFLSNDIHYQIQYGSLDIYRAAMPSNHTIKETQYWRKKAVILNKPFVDAVAAVVANQQLGIQAVAAVAAYGQDEQEAELITLETDYPDCKSYEVERGKEIKEWNRHHNKAFGTLAGCVDESIWQDVKCGKSIQIIWNNLAVATGQKTNTNWLAALRNVFAVQYNDNETLTTLIARVIKANNRVAEFEDDEITFKPLQILAKIISLIAHVPKYNLLLQSIHQIDKTVLSLDKIKNIFLEEDKRVEFSIRNQPKPPKPEINQFKEAKQRQPKPKKEQREQREQKKHEKDVPCATQGCKGKVNAGQPINYTKCSKCFVPFKKNDREKPKIGSFLALSTKDRSSQTVPGALYLDSGCTVHVTTGDTKVINRKKMKVQMSGPSGEIMESTHTGTIVFPRGETSIHFRDALVVPSLERNLLSLSKMLDSNPELFVVFNKDRFEGFKGQIKGVGTTLFQGEKDSSNLFALLSTIDETKVIVPAEAGAVAQVEISDCVLNTERTKEIARDSTSPNFSHVRKRDGAPIVEIADTTLQDFSNDASTIKIAATDLAAEVKQDGDPNFANQPLKVIGEGLLDQIFAGLLDNAKRPILLDSGGLPRSFGASTDALAAKGENPDLAKDHVTGTSENFSITNFSDTITILRPMPKFFGAINVVQIEAAKKICRTLDEWHAVLAHISKSKILKLAELGLIEISNPTAELSCMPCAAAKMVRKPFSKSMPPKASAVGDVLHSDVAGPISPDGLFGEKYFVTFIDELSGYVVLRPMKNKSEVFGIFKEIRALINNQANVSSVKMFVTDGGGEYIDGEFLSFLKAKGIIHVQTPPNTPQRNGMSERFNRTIMGLVRAMINARKMPKKFWLLAALYAVYVINRTPKIGRDKVRHEMLFGAKPSFKKLLEFGTPVMFHNHDSAIKKMHDRAFEGIFVGFWEEDHTYKIFDVSTSRLISTRTIKAFPNDMLEFENNDWNTPFYIEDERWVQDTADVGFTYNDLNLEDDRDLYEDLPKIAPRAEINLPPNMPQVEPRAEINLPPNLPPIEEPRAEINQPQNLPPNIPPIYDEPIQFDIFDNEVDQTEAPELRRSTRNTEVKYGYTGETILGSILNVTQIEQIMLLADDEATPKSFKKAMEGNNAIEWKEAVRTEFQSLLDYDTFDKVDRPKDKKVIRTHLIFKIKRDEKDNLKYKVRLVARGDTQIEGENFFEVFSPTLRSESIRRLVAFAVQTGGKIHHLDVQTAFLNAPLEEDVYLEIPEGFEDFGSRTKVLKLNKSIYGLRQAGRNWNALFKSTLLNMGYIQSAADPCIFLKYNQDNTPISAIGVFVDDCLVIGGIDQNTIVRDKLMEIFKMHDLGPLKFALGIKFDQEDGTVKLSQQLYVDKMLEKFSMQDCKPTNTPLPIKSATNIEPDNKPLVDINKYQQIIGSLIFISNSTRPDIAYAVSQLARAMHAPLESDLTSAKRVLRYLKGTRDYALNYNNKDQDLIIYSDSSWAEETGRKSVGGYASLCAGAAISWKSTKQPIIAQSTMEAEYIALAEAAKEAQWLRKLEIEFFPKKALTPTTICEDNQSTIKLSNNPLHTNRSKHIDIRYHKIQELVADKTINIKYVPGTEMTADIMTKSLGPQLHHRHVAGLGLIDIGA